MTTANVLAIYNGTAPFDVTVTACDLLTDLSVKDFNVVNVTDNVTEDLINWTKVSPTLVRYVGGSTTMTLGDTIEIRRKTPNSIVQPVAYASRFSSSLWNAEFDRVIRWREEADLNGVGAAATGLIATPNPGVFNSTWSTDTVNPPTRSAVYSTIANNLITKNYIVNGGMKVWQRGVTTSITGAAATNLDQRAIIADNIWLTQFTTSGTSRSMTMTREPHTLGQTLVPNNPKYYLRVNFTAAGAPGGGFFTRLVSIVEDVTTLAGKQVTLSLYARSSIASKTLGYRVMRSMGSGGSGSSDTGATGSWLLSSNFARYSVTFTMPTLTGQTFGTEGTDGYFIMLYLNSSVGEVPSNINFGLGTVDISNVQLEISDAPTSIEEVPFAVELTRCKRYYQQGSPYSNLPTQTTFGGVNFQYPISAAGQWAHTVAFPETMAFTPTIQVNATDGSVGNMTRGGVISPLNVSNINSNAFFAFNNSGINAATYYFNWSATCNYF